MICIPIISKSINSALSDIRKASKLCDIIELRIDHIKYINKNKFKKLLKTKKPVIVTNRNKKEGGNFKGKEKTRINLLKEAINLNADYVDIEYNVNKKLLSDLIKNKKNLKIIASYHNFKETPNNKILNNIYNKIKKTNCDIIKIVTYANSINDNFKIFELLKKANKDNKKIIGFCMGEYGQISRILCLKYGSFLTFASLKKGKESASGQLSFKELKKDYNIDKINSKTKIIGLIGNPVEHSWSNIIHNNCFKKLNLNYIYLKFKVDNLERFMQNFRKFNFKGTNVTIPYKLDVIKYLDKIDKLAENIGAVNTIVKKNGKLIGYNTDCHGAIKAIKEKTEIKNKNVVILGAGGATRAIAYGIKQEEGNLILLNRTVGKAKKLAKELNCNYGSLDFIKELNIDILINSTSVGMYPKTNQSLIDKKYLKNMVVFDAIFNPYKTKLLRDAEKNNCIIISGAEMLIHQAVLAFKLWTNKIPNIRLIRNSIRDKLR